MQDGTDRTIGRVRLSPSGIRQCAGQCAATRDEPTVIYPGRCLQSGLHRADAPHQAEAHLEWHHSCVSALWAWHYTPCSHRPHMHVAPLHTRPYIDFRRQCLRLSVCSATVASQDTHMSGTSSGATTERDSDCGRLCPSSYPKILGGRLSLTNSSDRWHLCPIRALMP